MFHASDLGVLGELGASRFSGPKGVRAKDAKVRKAVAGLPIDYTGWRAFGWRGLPGSVSPTTADVAGGVSGLG